MPDKTFHEIPVTEESLWFLERYLNVFDFLELFPPETVSKAGGSLGQSVIIHTDLGFSIESDIDHSKMQLRNRSKLHGWTRFTTEHGLQIGDTLRIDRLSHHEYSLRLIRSNQA